MTPPDRSVLHISGVEGGAAPLGRSAATLTVVSSTAIPTRRKDGINALGDRMGS
jgi:hypothetical protein